MRIIERHQIENLVDRHEIMDALRNAFVSYAHGNVNVPAHAYLHFEKPPADCHVRTGYIQGLPYVVKVSNGFYDNPKRGLPSSDGFMALLSIETGAPLAILADRGYLTDLRTALTGALATQLLAPKGATHCGIIGAGIQARMHIEELHALMPELQITIWGRDPAKSRALAVAIGAKGIICEVQDDLEKLCLNNDILITTTPAREPLIRSEWVHPEMHITAVGSDAPGKQELEAGVLGKADYVVADTVPNCVKNGEIGHALKANKINLSDIYELGTVIESKTPLRKSSSEITVADLTGSALQDVAIANAIWAKFLKEQA